MLVLYILGGVFGFVLLVLLLLLLLSLFIRPTEYADHSPFWRGVLNMAAGIVLKLMRIRIHAEGIEKIPADTKNLLFVGNHISAYDPIVSVYVLRHWQPAFLSKPSNFRIPIFGRIIRKCCFLPIDRENPRNAIKTIRFAAELLGRGEVSVGVYPEGTRSKTGELLPFHNGVFKIAQKAGASVVVLHVTGTDRVHKNFPFRRTDVYLKVPDVLPAAAHEKTDVMGDRVRTLLEQES